MKNSGRCPKCGSGQIARIPDNGRYANGNNIYLKSAVILADRIPLTKYICCECGYAEEWVESRGDLAKIEDKFRNSES